MNGKRRILSAILAAVMLTSFLSVGGYAQEEAVPGELPAESLVQPEIPDMVALPPEEEAPETTEAPVETEAPQATAVPEETAAPVPTELPGETEQLPLDGAVSGTCGDNLTWTLEEGVLTVSGTGDMKISGTVPWMSYVSEIHEVVVESGVTSIGMAAFGLPNLVKVTMAETVTRIEDYAFYFADSLEEIVLHEGITHLGSYLFYGDCPAEMTIPASVKTFGVSLFVNCASLEKLVFADGTTKIPANFASGNEGIDTVVIPGSVTEIGEYAIGDEVSHVIFRGTEADWAQVVIGEGNADWLQNISFRNVQSGACGSGLTWTLEDGTLTVSGSGSMADFSVPAEVPWFAWQEEIARVVIKDGVTSVGSRAFAGCTAVKSVEIGSEVWYIGHYAFADCGGLTELTLPEGVKTVDDYAFSGCSGLEKLTLPDSLTTIDLYAFGDCTALTEVELPCTMAMLGEHAFYGCTSLKEVIIPVSMRRVASHAFGGCESIENVYYDASPEKWEYILFGIDNEYLKDAIIHYQYKNGVPEIVNTELERDEVGFYVFDYARKEPVAGAAIVINGTTVLSGADGCAAIALTEGNYNFTLSCDGYADQNITMNLEGREMYVLSMMPRAEMPTVFSVELYEGDSPVCSNVLTERGYIKEGSGGSYTLALSGGYDGSYVSTFCFYQNNEQLFTMNAGPDSAGSITVSAAEFEKDAPVYVRAVGSDGTKGSMQLTNIHVVPDTSRLSEHTVGLGENIEIAVDEDIPLLGGSKLTVELDDLPIYAETEEDGTVRIAINFYEDSWNETTGATEQKNHLTRTDWLDLKEAATSVPEELGDFLKMGPDKRFQIGESAEAKFQVWGYLEGNVGTGDVSGRIVVVAQVEVGETWQFIMPPVSLPVVIEMTITAEMKAGIEAVMNAKTLDEARLEGTVEPEFTVAVGGGPGIAKVASATINGSGTLKHTRTLSAEKITDLTEFTAKLFVKLKLLFMEYTKDWGKPKTWELHNSETVTGHSQDGEPLLDGAMEVDNYSIAGRSYLADTSPWMGEVRMWSHARTTTQSAKLLQSSVYEDTQLEIVQAGDTVMAFFLTDDPSRADIDRTMLVYTVYDPRNDTWSQPAALENDGTADFYPSVSTDGETVWVAWADMKNPAGDVTVPDVEAIAAGMDITMAVYEDGGFTVKPVTDDGYMDTTPVVDNGSVAWIRSESANILGNDDSSVLCFREGGESKELRNTANVTDIAIGELGGRECIALVTDGDGNYATLTDRAMTLLATDGTVLQTVATGEVAQIAFTEDGLCWYESGSLRCLEAVGENPGLWQDMEGLIPGAWQIAETGGKTWLLFLGSHADEENGLTDTELYACVRENGGWGHPVRLTELGMNIQRFEAYTANGSVGVMIALSDMSDDDGLVTETVSLCALTVIENCDYALLDMECGKFTAESGEYVLPFSAAAANIGSGAGGNYTLELRRNGETLSQLGYEGLGAGDTETLSGVFELDAVPARDGEYTVVLCGEDTDESNNGALITPGIDDLSVYVADYSIAHAGYTVSVSVENKGIYDSNAVLNVRLGSSEGDILLTESAFVAAGDKESFLVRFDAMDLAFDDPSMVICFEVLGEHDDCFEADNEDTFVVFRPELYEEHTEHSAVTLAAEEPTCTKNGVTEGSACGICGQVLVAQEIRPSLGHEYEHRVTEPACTAQGYTTHICERCGDTYVDTYTPAVHAWDEGVITVTPGPDTPGQKVYTCTACGETIEQELVLKTASGDVDMDGDADIVDVWLVMYHTVGTGLLIEPAPRAADVNGDERVNARDAAQILRYISDLPSILTGAK